MPLAIEKKKRRPRGGDAAEGSDGAPGKGKRPRQANVSSGAEESNADRRPKASRSAREPPRVTRDHKDEVAKKRVKKHKHVGRGELEGEEDVRPTKVEDEKDQRVGRAKMPLTRRLGMQREENSTSDEVMQPLHWFSNQEVLFRSALSTLPCVNHALSSHAQDGADSCCPVHLRIKPCTFSFNHTIQTAHVMLSSLAPSSSRTGGLLEEEHLFPRAGNLFKFSRLAAFDPSLSALSCGCPFRPLFPEIPLAPC